MGMIKFCHVKKNDQVIVLTGDFKKKVGVVTSVIKRNDIKNRFFVTLDSLPKKSLKKKKSSSFIEKDVLLDSSNVRLLQVSKSES
jgi:ribosomal protein L24